MGLEAIALRELAAQWFLRDGKEHPLKTIGCVAAIFVLVAFTAWQTFFKA